MNLHEAEAAGLTLEIEFRRFSPSGQMIAIKRRGEVVAKFVEFERAMIYVLALSPERFANLELEGDAFPGTYQFDKRHHRVD